MTYLLLVFLPAVLFSLYAQSRVRRSFKRYGRVVCSSRMTGAEAARTMLREARLDEHVAIEQVDGFLSDHYDPIKKVLRLSPGVYASNSLAAVGVACHEAGHAIQDAKAYAPLVIRNAAVPMANFGSTIGYLLIIAGLLFHWFGMALVGLVLFATVVAFQIINLPVEFNASARARRMVADLGIIDSRSEKSAIRSVLSAAALTYVAATVTALANLAYYGWMVLGRRD